VTTTEPVILGVLDAAEIAITEMRQHGLTANYIEFRPGSNGRRWDHKTKDFTRPCFPQVRLHGTPQQFLTWVEHLQIERIHVKRRDSDTCLNAGIDYSGLFWSVGASVDRPVDQPHLPGITVDWERQRSGRRGNDASITLAELRTTLAALGVAPAFDTKGGQS
jgi:hypothetical protein